MAPMPLEQLSNVIPGESISGLAEGCEDGVSHGIAQTVAEDVPR
jgi:hypothetical protein